jgi:hypothetical protein
MNFDKNISILKNLFSLRLLSLIILAIFIYHTNIDNSKNNDLIFILGGLYIGSKLSSYIFLFSIYLNSSIQRALSKI